MIKIQNLTAGYGKKIVLSDINLELENQTYGIIGPNGIRKKQRFFRVLTSFRMLTSKNYYGKPENLLMVTFWFLILAIIRK